jgi:hypothetical protein
VVLCAVVWENALARIASSACVYLCVFVCFVCVCACVYLCVSVCVSVCARACIWSKVPAHSSMTECTAAVCPSCVRRSVRPSSCARPPVLRATTHARMHAHMQRNKEIKFVIDGTVNGNRVELTKQHVGAYRNCVTYQVRARLAGHNAVVVLLLPPCRTCKVTTHWRTR